MQFMHRNHCLVSIATLFLVGVAGCSQGPSLGTVSGTVKLNGQPLPYAYVVFQPINPPGAYGSAYANERGEYQLQFTRYQKGAPVGKHRVSIRAANGDELPDGTPPGSRIKLPAKYNSETELVRDVVSGHNQHDFELQGTTIVSSRR